MAKVGENHERLKKNHWLRALQLAKIPFDDEGYFIDYLLDIGKPFPFHDMRITVCINKRQIICKIKPPADKDETTS